MMRGIGIGRTWIGGIDRGEVNVDRSNRLHRSGSASGSCVHSAGLVGLASRVGGRIARRR